MKHFLPTRIRRLTRRTLGVMVGLMLGWYAAGLAIDPSFAAPPPAEVQHGNDGHAHGDHANPAQALVPHEPIHWYRPVLFTAGGLFLAAIILGIPALKLRGPLPPDPAAALDDHHDDHGHDSHAPAPGAHH